MNSVDAEVFNKVAETLSFTKAGRLLGMTRSAVSKRIARLEKDLAVVLVNRTPRSISLTDAGRNFYRHSQEIDNALRQAKESVRGTHSTPSGKLSFTMPTSLGSALMPALMREFNRDWPEIELSINLDERYVDVVGDGYDVAIRLAKKLDNSTLMFRKLCSTPQVLVASPEYLKTHGRPTTINDLKKHKCLAVAHMSKRTFVWRFKGPEGAVEVPVNCPITANNDLAIVLATCLGNGIFYIPRILVASELKTGYLEIVLPEYQSVREYGVYAVYPNKNPPARVEAFIEFVTRNLEKIEVWNRWEPLQ